MKKIRNTVKAVKYINLVQKAKQRYLDKTLQKHKVKLSWCDLLPGEDLCQEINLWTYWQGYGYARKTPHIRFMLIGQDFGPPEKEEKKGTIRNVRLMNQGKDMPFHDGVDLSARDSWTDRELIRLFQFLGDYNIETKKYEDLFFTNCCLGYRKENYSGNMSLNQLSEDADILKELIDIVQPEHIICLGRNASLVTIRALIDKKFRSRTLADLIGDGTPYQYDSTQIFPVAHPGYWGSKARGKEQMDQDWKNIAERVRKR